MKKVRTIAEIGLNHNGDVKLAKEMIMVAKTAGFDYVKFQKRNPLVCVPEAEKSKPKSTPWGDMTYLEYKLRLEFGRATYNHLFNFCDELGIGIFSSVWDKDSVDFMYNIIGGNHIMKIPSALITDLELCKYARSKSNILMVSTGMSTQEEIDVCVNVANPDVIFHTNSTYPSPEEDLNLRYIQFAKDRYPNKEIGYSGHEFGLVPTFAAVALGATWVERHITMDRNLWGSDQKASIEPTGLYKLIKGIRDIEAATSFEPQDRILFESELVKRKTLRGV